MWCHVFTGSDPQKSVSWVSSPLWEASSQDGSTRDNLDLLSEFHLMSNVSKCISYIDLFMWIRRISTFSSNLAVTWRFCPNDTLLLVHQSACFMNELQWTVFVSLLEGGKKRNCPRISKSKLRPSPTVLSCNQVDMTDQHVYQSAYWVGWHKTLYQMLAKKHVTEFPTSCLSFISSVWFTIQEKVLQCFSWQRRHTCASDWTCSSVMSGFGFYLAPNANTTWSSVLRCTSQQCRMLPGPDWGWFWGLDVLVWERGRKSVKRNV